MLTPNVNEFAKLAERVLSKQRDEDEEDEEQKSGRELRELCAELGYVTIVRKGQRDIVSDGKELLVCDQQASLRRQGGQGDLLTGLLATFLHWQNSNDHHHTGNTDSSKSSAPVSRVQAAWAACLLLRACSRSAFEKHARATSTPAIISEIGPVFAKYFEQPDDR